MAPAPELPKFANWPAALDAVAKTATMLRRTTSTMIPHEDLLSVGQEALVLAEQQFDGARGVPFLAYARLRIRRSMIDSLRNEGRLSGRSAGMLRAVDLSDGVFLELAADEDHRDNPQSWANASSTAATLATIHGLDFGGSPEERLARAQLKKRAADALAKRPVQVQKFFRLVYEDGLSLDAAAKRCGISPSWATRLHAKEIAHLARELKAALEPRATAHEA